MSELTAAFVQYAVEPFLEHEDWQSLLNRADSALHEAKNQGRSSWVAAEE